MAARPRFLLVPTVPTASSRLVGGGQPAPAWRFVPGAALIDTTSVGWRLLGANNRELGRGVSTFPVAAAREHVRALQGAAHELVTVVSSGLTGKWVWTATLDSVAVATSARSYHRQRECLYSARHFVAAVAVAGVGAAPADEHIAHADDREAAR